jgi:hypothetical protein
MDDPVLLPNAVAGQAERETTRSGSPLKRSEASAVALGLARAIKRVSRPVSGGGRACSVEHRKPCDTAM